jgi:hypothetical protein
MWVCWSLTDSNLLSRLGCARLALHLALRLMALARPNGRSAVPRRHRHPCYPKRAVPQGGGPPARMFPPQTSGDPGENLSDANISELSAQAFIVVVDRRARALVAFGIVRAQDDGRQMGRGHRKRPKRSPSQSLTRLLRVNMAFGQRLPPGTVGDADVAGVARLSRTHGEDERLTSY